ncbi:uncharacterized protein LOC132197881 [Neocloeon triangulifer]|uniref:uncharacterized protein LOC132197881 n=1 Tax=Neocloeon triangulifer TaxID=2078957 RepID=UPI00286F28A8|nr:uncharacterized protein LOC132197881 [Neocloeon triangulifer]
MTTTSSATLLTNTDSSHLTGVMSSDPGANDLMSSPPATPENCKMKDEKSNNPMSLSTSSRDVQEIDTRDRRLVYVSGGQLVLGGVILAWAGAVVSNDASLAGASAAAALIGGVFGLVAGVAGFASRRRKLLSKSNHSSSVVTVATSAIALAACSLVIALSATGLLRDGNRPALQVTWGALIANVGLLLTSGLMATSCVIAAALWRKDAGLCTSRHRRARAAAAVQQPLPCTPPVPHKHKLINNWLGQQQGPPLFMISPMSPPSGGSIYGGSIPPHIVPLHMPPPPMVVPPYMLPHPMGPPPPCMLHAANMTMPIDRRERRHSRHKRSGSTNGDALSHHSLSPDVTIEKDPKEEERLAVLAAKRQRPANAFTDEELEQSYTGLDRVIAEDFISHTIERHQRQSSQSASRKSSVSTGQTSAVIEHSRL